MFDISILPHICSHFKPHRFDDAAISRIGRYSQQQGNHRSSPVIQNLSIDIVDLLVASTSIRTDISVLTGDKEFKKLNC